jgi:thymus-specific serine protease
MRTILALAFLALVGSSSASIESRVVDLQVDHFNPLDRRTFEARYFNNPEHWIPGGVIFLYIPGGFEVYDEFLTSGAMFELARDTNSHLFTLEHRYFGRSRPTEDTSVENLRFLTVHQALADIAQFVTFIRENYYGARNSRVIVWGRGYGGNLAVWARQKYPNAVDAVWASSAPINAVLEYPQFMRNTFYTIWSIGDRPCGDVLTAAFRMIEDAVRTRNTTYVEERLNLCNPIDLTVEEEVTQLFYQIANEIGFNFVTNARYPEIDEKCRIMRGVDDEDQPVANPPENALDGFARWYIDEFNRNLECLNFGHNNVVARYQQVAWDTVSTIAGRRQTFWLQCTQLGQFSVANEGEGHPFGWRFDLNFFRQWCARAFDEEL